MDELAQTLSANKNKETVTSLEDFASEPEKDNKVDFGDVVGQDSLTRFDRPNRNKNRRNNRKKSKRRNNSNQKQEARPSKRKNNQSNTKKSRPPRKKR